MLNAENYREGFLVDEEWMAGVAQHPESPSLFIGFILRHATGEYVGCHSFADLRLALEAINRIQRPWTFERLGGCGGSECSQPCKTGGKCGKTRACPQA